MVFDFCDISMLLFIFITVTSPSNTPLTLGEGEFSGYTPVTIIDNAKIRQGRRRSSNKISSVWFCNAQVHVQYAILYTIYHAGITFMYKGRISTYLF